jgi:uncharacterized membrane protein
MTRSEHNRVHSSLISPLFWKRPGFWIGSGIALWGLTRRGRARVALVGTGGALLYLHGLRDDLVRSHASVLLQCTPEEAYRFWHDFSNLPAFLKNVQSVETLGDEIFHWTLRGSHGERMQTAVAITADCESSLIEWRSLPGCTAKVAGRVQFRPEVAGRGTVVSATLFYPPQTVGVGYRVMRMIDRKPSFLATQDLRRFKALIEAGEIPTTVGQPHGPRTVATGAMRRLNPDQPVPPTSDVRVATSEQRRIA